MASKTNQILLEGDLNLFYNPQIEILISRINVSINLYKLRGALQVSLLLLSDFKLFEIK